MQLSPLTGAALLLLALMIAGPVKAQALGINVATKVNSYADNDNVTVITPMLKVDGQATEMINVRASAVYDVVTAASVDVVSSATPAGQFEEVRQAYDAGVSLAISDYTVDVSAMWSGENDYSSYTIAAGLGAELWSKTTTLSLGYSFTDSSVGRAKDTVFSEELGSHTVTASVTQMLTPELLLQVGYFLGQLDGFQSSPYRTALLNDATRTPERTPSSRTRHAISARLRWAPLADLFVGADYRLYVDTWGIDSHTGVASLTHAPIWWFEWRVQQRFYGQSGADFYEERYARHKAYMTADRELGPMWSSLTGLKATFRPDLPSLPFTLELDIKFEAGAQLFSAFSTHPVRSIFVNEVGVRASF